MAVICAGWDFAKIEENRWFGGFVTSNNAEVCPGAEIRLLLLNSWLPVAVSGERGSRGCRFEPDVAATAAAASKNGRLVAPGSVMFLLVHAV